MTAPIQFPQGPPLDPQTGEFSLEWFMWLQNLQSVLAALLAAFPLLSANRVGMPGADGQDGEDGAMGIPGPSGPQGARGTFMPGIDGQDGENSGMLATPIKAPDSYRLEGATWEAPGAIGSVTPSTINGTTGAFSGAQNSQFTALTLTNATSGTGAFVTQPLVAGTSLGYLHNFSQGYTTSNQYAANTMLFEHASGNVGLSAANAGGTVGGWVNGVKITSASSTGFTVIGTVKTSDPGLGAGAWKLGQVESGIGLALNTTSYIQVMVDGVAVKLAQVL